MSNWKAAEPNYAWRFSFKNNYNTPKTTEILPRSAPLSALLGAASVLTSFRRQPHKIVKTHSNNSLETAEYLFEFV